MTVDSRAFPARSAKPDRFEPWGCLTLSVVTLAFGLAALVPMWFLPTWRAFEARDWLAVSCTIEKIGVAWKPFDSATTSSSGSRYTGWVDVLYSYELDGQTFQSSRFDFAFGTTSDDDFYEKAVERHPVGPDTCWVNPDDPSEAVVERRSGAPWWILAFLPLPLMGAWGVLTVLSLVLERRPTVRDVRGPITHYGTPGDAAPSREDSAPDVDPRKPAPSPIVVYPAQSATSARVVVAIIVLGVLGLLAFRYWKELPAAPATSSPTAIDTSSLRWEDVYARGDLQKAWNIASDHADLHRIETLLADGVDPDTPVGTHLRRGTALINAAWRGNPDVVARLLAAGADPMAREVHLEPPLDKFGGDTALHRAAFWGHVGIVRMLLVAGVPASVEGFQGGTPLMIACGDLETFELLLAAGADVEKAGGLDALFENAVYRGSTEVASFLLERGAPIEGDQLKRDHGYTPLWTAAMVGNEDMVRFLLANGADPHVTPGGNDLVELTRDKGHEQEALMIARARE